MRSVVTYDFHGDGTNLLKMNVRFVLYDVCYVCICAEHHVRMMLETFQRETTPVRSLIEQLANKNAVQRSFRPPVFAVRHSRHVKATGRTFPLIDDQLITQPGSDHILGALENKSRRDKSLKN